MKKELRKLYLQDLNKEVCYDGVNKRKRVRHIELWEGIKPTLYAGHETFIELPPKDQTRNIWVWSDQHFSHKNIIKFSKRPYPNPETMNKCMLKNFQQLVQPNDISIWVGDVAFKDINELLDQCPGYKILVVGNHDFNKKKLRRLNFDEVHLLYHMHLQGIDYVFTHYPMSNLPVPMINIHGHIHNNVPKTISLQQINVCVEVTDYKPISMFELQRIARARVDSME